MLRLSSGSPLNTYQLDGILLRAYSVKFEIRLVIIFVSFSSHFYTLIGLKLLNSYNGQATAAIQTHNGSAIETRCCDHRLVLSFTKIFSL